MNHLEFFINRVNVNDVPNLNKEQFKFILKAINLEGQIQALDTVDNKIMVSEQRQKLLKEFNRLTKRRKQS
ncbi:hypothetical protein [Polaribacter sp.]|uniref:hypothetical protein n=1 Tax=Polaribacter sp. TaxID=1920175 RepID=UPI0025FBE65E|nr:hypothetical protein [Polaribacter sp.]